MTAGRFSVIVVPCFNERDRLRAEDVAELTAGGVDVLLVDDGSTDGTAALLDELADTSRGHVHALLLPQNVGKGEAVRAGMIAAIAMGATFVGYADADFATPGDEVLRLERLAAQSDLDVVIGSRVMLLGRSITRRARRHYLGRVFATCASLVLGVPVYDTQCGAKVFRVTPELCAALDVAFASRWGFDVELLGRLDASAHPGALRIREEPLETWRDVAGSKIGVLAGVRAAIELVRVRRALTRYAHAPRDGTAGRSSTDGTVADDRMQRGMRNRSRRAERWPGSA